MSKILPQFPLQLVVFPEEILNLHIFEPRYKQLVNDCQTEQLLFGIPTVVKSKPPSIGTVVKLLAIEKTYADGKMDIKCKGMNPYKIHKFIDKLANKLYAGAEIELIDKEESGTDYLLNQKIIEQVLELYRFMKITKTIEEDPQKFDLFQVAHKIGLTLNQELQLLSLNSQKLRQDFVYDHLQNLIPIVKKMELMRKKIQMNGHFKNVSSS